jgi:hypothetical protein
VPACPRSPGQDEPHSGQITSAPSWSTNSPQTRHSRLAPRASAHSSCSSVWWRKATVMRSLCPISHESILKTPVTLPRTWT